MDFSVQGEKHQQGLCLLHPCQFLLLTLSFCHASLCSALHPAASAKPNATDPHPLLCSAPEPSTALGMLHTFNWAHFISMALLGELSTIKVPHMARCRLIPPLKSFKSKEVRQKVRVSYLSFSKPNSYMEMPFIPYTGNKLLK